MISESLLETNRFQLCCREYMTLINRHFIMVNVGERKMRIQDRDDVSAEIHIKDVDDSKIANAVTMLGGTWKI